MRKGIRNSMFNNKTLLPNLLDIGIPRIGITYSDKYSSSAVIESITYTLSFDNSAAIISYQNGTFGQPINVN